MDIYVKKSKYNDNYYVEVFDNTPYNDDDEDALCDAATTQGYKVIYCELDELMCFEYDGDLLIEDNWGLLEEYYDEKVVDALKKDGVFIEYDEETDRDIVYKAYKPIIK